MALELPQPSQAYFDGNPTFDVDAMLAPFALDALVHDEKNQCPRCEKGPALGVDGTVSQRCV